MSSPQMSEVLEVRVVPCDGCRHHQRCSDEVICCTAFCLFARLNGEHGAARWRLAPRHPSRAHLEALRAGRQEVPVEKRQQLAVQLMREADY